MKREEYRQIQRALNRSITPEIEAEIDRRAKALYQTFVDDFVTLNHSYNHLILVIEIIDRQVIALGKVNHTYLSTALAPEDAPNKRADKLLAAAFLDFRKVLDALTPTVFNREEITDAWEQLIANVNNRISGIQTFLNHNDIAPLWATVTETSGDNNLLEALALINLGGAPINAVKAQLASTLRVLEGGARSIPDFDTLFRYYLGKQREETLTDAEADAFEYLRTFTEGRRTLSKRLTPKWKETWGNLKRRKEYAGQ